MDTAHLHTLLESLAVADNDIRKQAEDYYASMISDNTTREMFLVALVSCLNVVDRFSTSQRKLATILIRRILISGEGVQQSAGDDAGDLLNSFTKLSADSKTQIKTGLLASVEVADNSSFFSNICDLIGELYCNFLEPSDWPEAQQYMEYSLQSSDPQKRMIGFSLLGHLSESICRSDSFSDSIGGLCMVINSGLQVTQDENCIDLMKSSMQTLTYIMLALESESQVLAFKDLVPPIIFAFKSLVQLAQTQAEDSKVHEVTLSFVENWIEIAEDRALIFEENLGFVFDEIMTLIEQNVVSTSLRRMLIEFLTTFCCNRHKSVRKLKGPNQEKYYFAQRLFPMCVHLMLNVPDDTDWETYETIEASQANEDDGDVDFEAGQDALCRMTEKLGVKSTFSIVSSHLIELFKSSDWKCVHAALRYLGNYMIVSATIDRSEDKTSHQEELVTTLVQQIQRDHPRVRHAALYAMSELIRNHHETLETRHLSTILTVLLENVTSSANKAPLVRLMAIGAIYNLIVCAPVSFNMEQHVSRILSEMHTALSEGPFSVQEECVDVITSLADSLKDEETMANYYDALMPILKSIMEFAKANGQESLWGKTLECCAMLGEASGKAKFFSDASEMMNSLVEIQSQISDDSNLRKFLMKAWVRIARCLGVEFLPFLQIVMENLITAITQDVTKGTGDVDLDVFDEEQSDIEMISTGDGFHVFARTSAVEEQLAACELTVLIIEKLQESFYPYVESTTKAMLTLLQKSPHEDVRSACMQVIPEIIRCTAKATLPDRSALKVLSDFAIGQLVLAIDNDRDRSIDLVRTGLQSLKSSLLFACSDWASLSAMSPHGNFMGTPPMPSFDAQWAILNEEHLVEIVQKTKAVLKDSIQRRAIERAEAAISAHGKDDDDEDDEQRMLDECKDLHFNIVYLLEMLFRTHGSTFLPVYLREYNEVVTELSQAHCLKEDRQFAFAVISDVVELGLDETVAEQFFQQSMPVILEAIGKCPDAESRVHASLAIKHATTRFPTLFSQYASTALSCLAESVYMGDGLGESRGQVTDIAVETIGFVLESMEGLGVSMDYDLIWGMVLDYLPIRHDKEEGHNVLVQLARLIKSRHPRFTSEDKLMQAIVIFLRVVNTPLSSDVINEMIVQTIHFTLENQLVSKDNLYQFIARHEKGIQEAFSNVLNAATSHSTSPGASAPIHDVLFRP